ncbi:sialate:O-sulfotransferase 1-like [Panulirus ornatus]|uniref:sialate:O-sulfotransferase 1-like n=1 Tax=Panulirus ornatus TaxID=150431 RepID=UPI003A83A219
MDRFGKGLQRVWLLSYPGSGNTWIRYLLEGATGVFTGSVFKDIMIYNDGMLGEADAPTSGRTLVQKTHGLSIGLPSKGLNSRFDLGKHHLPTILLIRDPAKEWLLRDHETQRGGCRLSTFGLHQALDFLKFMRVNVCQQMQAESNKYTWMAALSSNASWHLSSFIKVLFNFNHGIPSLTTQSWATCGPRAAALIPCFLFLVWSRAFISSWNFKMSKTNKHTASMPKESFATSSFHEHVALAIPRWGELVLDKLLWSSAPVHVLHYEDLVQNTTHHLRQVLHFLRVPEDEGRLSCVLSHLSGSFRRIAREVIDPYTKKEKKAITNAVRRVNRLLLALNYPTLPAYRHLL